MPSYADPFRESQKMTLVDVMRAQEMGMAELLSEPARPSAGMACSTNGGTRYMWGPAFVERTNQWQDFILRTRDKITGSVFHYGVVNDFRPRPWTNWTELYVVAFPLQDAAANWIIKHMRESDEKHGIVVSGMLLADLIGWARRNNVSLRHDVIFTTFEPFPRSKVHLLFEHFGDWCDYSRAWDGGLTYYRCKYGTYHTLDHITILEPSVDENATSRSTDLLNKAQKFIDHPTGDIVSAIPLENSETCRCGAWHRNFSFKGRSGWTFKRSDGSSTLPSVVEVDDVDNEYQIVQRQEGRVEALRPGGWSGVSTPHLLRKISDEGISVSMNDGYYLRRGKRHFVFNEITRRGKKGILGGEGDDVPRKFSSLDA